MRLQLRPVCVRESLVVPHASWVNLVVDKAPAVFDVN